MKDSRNRGFFFTFIYFFYKVKYEMKMYPLLRSQIDCPIKLLINAASLFVLFLYCTSTAPFLVATVILLPWIILFGNDLKKAIKAESWYEWLSLVGWVLVLLVAEFAYLVGILFPTIPEQVFWLIVTLRLIFEVTHFVAYMIGWVQPHLETMSVETAFGYNTPCDSSSDEEMQAHCLERQHRKNPK